MRPRFAFAECVRWDAKRGVDTASLIGSACQQLSHSAIDSPARPPRCTIGGQRGPRSVASAHAVHTSAG